MSAVILSNIQHYFSLMAYWISRVFILYCRPDSTSDSSHYSLNKWPVLSLLTSLKHLFLLASTPSEALFLLMPSVNQAHAAW
jgi:hypothetical protein